MNMQQRYSLAPRCDACGSADTVARRSQGIQLQHDGQQCHAQRQYRQCRVCGSSFPWTLIKGPVSDRRPTRATGPWSGG